jgi:hypothetical protein
MSSDIISARLQFPMQWRLLVHRELWQRKLHGTFLTACHAAAADIVTHSRLHALRRTFHHSLSFALLLHGLQPQRNKPHAFCCFGWQTMTMPLRLLFRDVVLLFHDSLSVNVFFVDFAAAGHAGARLVL